MDSSHHTFCTIVDRASDLRSDPPRVDIVDEPIPRCNIEHMVYHHRSLRAVAHALSAVVGVLWHNNSVSGAFLSPRLCLFHCRSRDGFAFPHRSFDPHLGLRLCTIFHRAALGQASACAHHFTRQDYRRLCRCVGRHTPRYRCHSVVDSTAGILVRMVGHWRHRLAMGNTGRPVRIVA